MVENVFHLAENIEIFYILSPIDTELDVQQSSKYSRFTLADNSSVREQIWNHDTIQTIQFQKQS